MTTDEELKLLIAEKMDVLDFLDILGMDFPELIELCFEYEVNEESRAELERAVI